MRSKATVHSMDIIAINSYVKAGVVTRA
ncbi:hypothetical protein AG1IA_08778 [Rhizoctonia solani AG-1 IA]|uniref:Uncharacterized protein n=1 Tax=Thanatephorus cucumeris (strain AG1-IA) TaxID=983506 RepID=L8WGX9_THACA|nr:hypothetical protein AG1IA_08778 [Rhizoctonia solani AG-1 IA]